MGTTRTSEKERPGGTKKPTKKVWSVPPSHPSYVIEPCPNEECGYPEADGGYCPECGWSKPWKQRR